jgi:hypothetical protein
MGRNLIEEFLPEPEDEITARNLKDGACHEAMLAYGHKLCKLFDPV